MLGSIARLQLGRVAKRLQESHGLPFSHDDAVVDLIVSRCTEVESGGRMIDAILTNTLFPTISQVLLARMLEGWPVTRIEVSVAQDEFRYRIDDGVEVAWVAACEAREGVGVAI